MGIGGEDNIEVDLREMGWKTVDCVRLVQDRYQWRALVNTVMKLLSPKGGGDFLTS
jgi:hypothetical protein